MPTCPPDLEECWYMTREVPTYRPAYQMYKKAGRREVPTCRSADLPTRCRRRLEDEKRSANLPTCLRDVEEGWQMRSAGLPTCLPDLKEGSQMGREVPTCLRDVEEGWQMRSAGLPTCLPDLKECNQMGREVSTCRPAYQL